ncbi:MAG: anion permease [Desulfovibrio sp.]|nr:anion permease [Desulfovibrio sp.]
MSAATQELTPSLLVKWAASLAVPLALYFLCPRSETLTSPMIAFLAVTLWAVMAWAMETMNGIAVGLLLPIFYIVLCKVPQKVVFAPWLGDVAIIVIGGFTLGKIIGVTGLGKRIALSCVKAMGGSLTGALVGFTLGACIVAPFVPSLMGKGAIFCAIAVSLCDAMEFKPKSREATAVMLCACIAVGSTKLAYLTGGADLVMGMGLVDKVTGHATSWMEYAKLNFVPAMIYAALSLLLVIVVLRSKADPQLIRRAAAEKYAELGPVTAEEKRTIFLFALTLVLLATDTLHKLTPGTVLILITGLAFMPGMNLMDAKRLASINFAPLFFIMGCMCIGAAGGFLKVTQWMAQVIFPVFESVGSATASGVSCFVGFVLNFLLTPLAATSTMTAPLAELGLKIGIDPRILFFSFQYGLDNLIFPYEYALYLYFFSTGYINFKDMVAVMSVRIVMSCLFVAFIATPFWRFMLG